MQTANSLLLATGTLLLTGCSLLINEQLDGKAISGGGGSGGAQAVTSTGSTTSSVTTSSSAAGSASSSSGGCGSACALNNATSACNDGACTVTACTGKFDDCDKTPENGCEVDLNDDPAHCGSCGHECKSGEDCSGGKCK